MHITARWQYTLALLKAIRTQINWSSTLMTCCKNPAKAQLFHVFICICGSSVGLCMYDYRSLRVVVTICAILVNTDSFWPIILLAHLTKIHNIKLQVNKCCSAATCHDHWRCQLSIDRWSKWWSVEFGIFWWFYTINDHEKWSLTVNTDWRPVHNTVTQKSCHL